jgi:acetoacetyl-CoA reductase
VGDHEATLENCAKIAQDVGPIDIVVNNAGVTRDGVLHKMSFEDWNEVMRINLGGCFNMAKATFPGMRERGWGRIVNIGSINGQAGQYGQVNYAAAKSGIHGFTKALAQEGAKYGVTVNAIAPGYIDTDMVAAVPAPVLEKIVAKIPVGRLGDAGEIARGVVFLTSEDGGFVTGSTMSINGGQHMY